MSATSQLKLQRRPALEEIEPGPKSPALCSSSRPRAKAKKQQQKNRQTHYQEENFKRQSFSSAGRSCHDAC